MKAWVALGATALLLALPASAVPEAEAPRLRADVLGVSHRPEVVEAGGDFEGILELRPGSNVTQAWVQVCRVGQACFAPPVAVERSGHVFAFRFSGPAGGGARLEGGWHVGVKWLLNETTPSGSRVVWFPEGLDLQSPACVDDGACQASHYFTFRVAPTKTAPAPFLIVIPLLLVLARRA